ncbi:MAG: SPFH domain-containing protein [Gemmataceae bacterium]|nr:SPFH domain-containing protein [Gemmataceae bacterium]
MKEKELKLASGFVALIVHLASLAIIVYLFVMAVSAEPGRPRGENVWMLSFVIPAFVAWLVSLAGYVVISPNQSQVVTFFGSYVGTVRDTGFYYGNPFYWRVSISLRQRTFETGMSGSDEVKDPTSGKVLIAANHSRKPSKVNDRDGTPIEIAAVVVWRVVNAAEAVFEVDNYEDYVKIQSEAALRNLASQHTYDGVGDERSLRGHTAEVGAELRRELQERLHKAGVEVDDARISYLAYAQEIAAAMLQRQQAGAMIAARRQVVDAAVGMVEHALDELSRRGVVELDPERKAAMVSNLLVVLCSHHNPQPIVNTGTLHN